MWIFHKTFLWTLAIKKESSVKIINQSCLVNGSRTSPGGTCSPLHCGSSLVSASEGTVNSGCGSEPCCPVAFKHRTVFTMVAVLKPTPQRLPRLLNNISPAVSVPQLEFSNVWKHFTGCHLFLNCGFSPAKWFPCSCLLGGREGYTGARY